VIRRISGQKTGNGFRAVERFHALTVPPFRGPACSGTTLQPFRIRRRIVIIERRRRLSHYSSKIFEVSTWTRHGHGSVSHRLAGGLIQWTGQGGDMAESVLPVAAGADGGCRLEVGDLTQIAVSVALSPQHSVVALVRRAAASRPGSGLAVLRQRMRPQSQFAFESFAASGPTTVPSCCLPIPPETDVTVAEQVSLLRELPGQVLLDQMRGPIGDHLPAAAWAPASDQPGRWLRSWADASMDVWALIEPWWRKAGPVLDRELSRIGTAVVRGGLDALLNSLHPRISYKDGFLTYALPWHRRHELGRRRLVLVPTLADEMLVSFDLPTVAYLAYPIRRPRPVHSAPVHSAPVPGDPLALVLGPARAAALRALRRPLTVSQIAAAIGCAPTTATYHIQHLTAAGLAVRERRGPNVQVSRTLRGAELVELLSG
jgi:DNA-binding transcriptional ArsR family regulator